jgi:hypothetical protein
MSGESMWIYGALVLAFGAIAYLFREVAALRSRSAELKSEFTAQLPLINQKLDSMSEQLNTFLRQEVDTLKELARGRD